jgi:hypothetical protein
LAAICKLAFHATLLAALIEPYCVWVRAAIAKESIEISISIKVAEGEIMRPNVFERLATIHKLACDATLLATLIEP